MIVAKYLCSWWQLCRLITYTPWMLMGYVCTWKKIFKFSRCTESHDLQLNEANVIFFFNSLNDFINYCLATRFIVITWHIIIIVSLIYLFPLYAVSEKKCHNASSAEWSPTILTRRLTNYQTSFIFLLCWVRNLIRMSKLYELCTIARMLCDFLFFRKYNFIANGSRQR